MSFLISLLILVLVIAVLLWLVRLIGLDPQALKIATAIVAVIGLIIVLGMLVGRVPLIRF